MQCRVREVKIYEQIFLKKLLSVRKATILEQLYDVRADKLGEEKAKIPTPDVETFLDVVENVGNTELKAKLVHKYLEDEN